MSTGLGGASFQVRADPAQFLAGMKKAKEEAARTAQQVGASVAQISSRTSTGLAAATRESDKLAASLNKVGGSLGKQSRFGMGLLQAGYFVDDLQYGLKAVVNNIPQMIYMIGGGAGLAGAVGIGAVAVSQLVNHWDSLIDRLQASWLNVAAADLAKMRVEAEKAGDAWDKLMATPDEAGGRLVSKLRDAMTDAKGGAGAIFKGLAESIALEPGMRAEETPDEKARRAAIMGIQPAAGQAGDDLRKKMAADIKAMDDKLAEANRLKAKEVQGGATVVGENQLTQLAKLRMLVEKNPGAFPADFRARLQQLTPERIQAELDLDNAKKARERARGVAGQLLGSPLGTQVMLGGAGGPANARELAALTGGPVGRRLKARGLGDAGQLMAAAGLTTDQAKGVMAAMEIGKMYEAGKARSKELGIPLGGMGQVDARVLDEVYKKAFTEAMKAAKGKPGGLEGAVNKALKGAGVVGQDPKEVLDEMRAQLADRRKNLMLETGMTKKQADMEILRQQQQQAFPSRPGGWVGALQFAHMVGEPNQIPRRSLDELIAIRKAIIDGQQAREMNRMVAAQGVAAGPE